jgi:hypothetical protein
MLITVVQHVAALAEGCQVGVLVVGRVVVAVRGSQHHPRAANPGEQVLVAKLRPEPAALAVAPARDLGIRPPAVPEVQDRTRVEVG